jgi:hypothetical protein
MTDEELQLLTWRFAAMIGIIKPSEEYSAADQVECDRSKWPHLIVSQDGDAVFDFDKCADWMVELSGEPLQRCRKILFAEWGDEEDQEHA